MKVRVIWQLARALRSQWWSQQAVREFQERQLVRMMRHATAHVPFYRELRIDPRDILDASALDRFPILTKRMIQDAPDAFLVEGANRDRLHNSRTSGSTGEPTVTYFDDDCWSLTKYALKMRRVIAVAPPLRRRCLIVSEQPVADLARYRHQRPFGAGLLYREQMVSLFDDLDEHVRVIRSFAPDMIYAFPSYFHELADRLRQEPGGIPHVPWLFTSSETLTPMARGRIESAFGGQLFDIYGSTEFKEIAWQCRAGSYHVNFESVFVETTPAGDSAARSLVISTLANEAMPLLRFQTGDLGSLAGSACACGRESPTLRVDLGREGEMLELPDGSRISPYLLTTVIETLPGLQQYRIRHVAPTRVVVELRGGPEPGSQTLEQCRRELVSLLKGGVDVAIERVDAFARGRGGKHKVFVREWDSGATHRP
jgi:phenylacetate-CoA ligase